MIKLVLRNSNGDLEETQISNDMILNPSQGEHYYFTGVSSYTFNLTDNDNTLDVYFIDNDGNRIHVVLQDLAQLIQLNNPMDVFSLDTIFGVSTNSEGDKQIEEALNNPEFESGEIVNALKEALSMDGSTLASGAVIDDFQSLLNMLDAAAAGGPEDTAYLSPLEESSQQDVLEEGGTSRPVSPDDVTLTTTDIPTDAADYNATITLGNISAAEGSTDVTISATVDNPPLTDLVITLDNGATITILAGQTSGTSTPFAVQGDDVYVDPGTETVTVSSTTGGGYDNLTIDGSATITVNDTIDDTTLSISGPTSVEEGTTAVYTLNITNPPLEDMLIDVEITNKADGPSNNPANGDVETEIIQVLIRAGETSSDPFTVDINDDNYIENPEDYQLEIIGYTGGNEFENLVIGESVTTAITDESVPTNPDDQTAYVSIDGPSTVVEGTTTSDYTVSIDQTTTQDVTVYFTYTGVAVDGTDFTGVASTVIPAGATPSDTFTITTIDDNILENSESFTITISSITGNGGLEDLRIDTANNSVTTAITDESVPTNPDDQTAYVSIDGPSTVVEGTTTSDYTVSIDQTTTQDVTVYFTYTGVAVDGTDFTGVASTVIPAGATPSDTFTITTIDDNILENSESFTITISSITGNGGLEDLRIDTANNSVTTAITDESVPTNPDDQTAYVSIDGPSTVVEGTTTSDYTVSIDQTTTQDVTVYFTYTGVAVDGTDFTGVASTVIPAGATPSDTFTITTIDDNILENSESFTITISSITGNGGLEDLRIDTANNSVTTAITDESVPTNPDDQTAYVSIDGPSTVVEGTTTSDYTVSIDQTTTQDVTVYFTYTGVAVDGTDFTGVASTVIPAGATPSDTFTITTIDDNILENSESFTITISSITGNGGLEDLRIDTANNSVTTAITDESVPTNPDDQTAYVSIDGPSTVVEGTTTSDYTVSIDQTTTQDVTVYFTYTGVAVDGTDFTGVASTVIPAGATPSDTFTITTIDDNILENSESFTITISSITGNGGLEDLRIDTANNSVTTAITDESVPTNPDDQTAYVSIDGPSTVVEGTTTSDYTVSIDQTTTQDVTVYFTYTGVAVDGTDFTGVASTVIPAGATPSDTFTITTIDDNILENSESFTITISSITGNGGLEDLRIDTANNSVTTAITDESVPTNPDDQTAYVSIDGPSTVVEGTTTSDYTVSIDQTTTQDVTVYFTYTGVAVDGTDFTGVASTVIPAGATPSDTFTITTIDDNILENSESFTITISSITGNGGLEDLRIDTANNSVTTAITDESVPTNPDDQTAYVSIDGPSTVVEGTTTSDYTVSIDQTTTQDVTVYFTYTGVAVDGTDFTGVASTVIPAGATPSDTFTITTIDDNILENSESFTITISSITGNGGLEDLRIDTANNSVTTAITDESVPTNPDDQTAYVSIDGPSTVVEGTTTSDYTVSIDQTTTQDVTVYFTYTGVAVDGTDFTGVASTVIPAGATPSDTFTITTIDDNILENSESFTITISSITGNGGLEDLRIDTANNSVTTAITDESVPTNPDDQTAYVSIDGPSTVVEGTTTSDYTVSIDQTTTQDVTVYFTYTGVAVDGTDFTGVASTVIPAGATPSDTFTITTIDDNILENSESFTITISSITGNGGLEDLRIDTANNSVTTAITDESVPTNPDDQTAYVSIDGPSTVVEGTTTSDYTVSIDQTTTQDVTVYFTYTGVAVDGTDFTGVASTVIPAGATPSDTFTITTIDDNILENSESFTITISSITGNGGLEDLRIDTANNSVTTAITDESVPTNPDDQTAYVSIDGPSTVVEGTTTSDYTVSIDQTTTQDVTVYFTYTGVAVDGTDFTGVASTVIPAGATPSDTFTITTIDDNILENSESFTITISSITGNGGLEDLRIDTANNSVTTAITDESVPTNPDDQTAYVSIDGPSTVVEGTTTSDYTVSIDQTTTQDVTVYFTYTGVAVDGTDFTGVASTVIPAGATPSDTFTITTIDDNILENSESFTITISSITGNGGLEDLRIDTANNSVTTAITDESVPTNPDDQTAYVSIDGPSTVVEGTTTSDYTVSIDQTTTQDVTVYFTYTGVAVDGTDFTGVASTVIPAGATPSDTFTITTIDDNILENSESFTITISSITGNGGLEDLRIDTANNSVTTAITDESVPTNPDDQTAYVSIDGPSTVVEGTTTSDYTVSIDQTTTQDVTVYFTYTGVAVDGTDFTGVASTVIPAGATPSDTFTITTIDDNILENSESFTITISSITGNGGLEDLRIDTANNSVTTAITDESVPTNPDDQTAYVSIDGPSTVVEGTTTSDYTVSIDQTTTQDVTVYFTYTGVAVDGTDFTGVASTVIPAGATPSDTFTITTIDDNILENSESFTITISSITGNGGLEDLRIDTANNSVTTAITDESVPTNPDDQTAYVSIDGPSTVVEGTTTSDYTVSIDQTTTQDVTVYFTYTGVAVDGTDFTGVASTVIPAGATPSDTFTITTIDDNILENSESFTITISSITGNGGLEDLRIDTANNSVTTAITDESVPTNPDDQTAYVSIDGPSTVVEGTTTSDYTVSIDQTTTQDVTVYFTYTGVAVDGTDFTGVASTVIPAGATPSDTFTITTIDDNILENSESFTITISSITGNGGLEDLRIDTANNSVTTAITDESVPTNPDDQTAYVSIDGPSTVVEGTTTSDYTVSIDQTTTQDVTVYFTYTGVAVDGTDFTGVASTVIPAGATPSDTFTITTIDDNILENSESFTITISSITGNGGLEDLRIDTANNSVTTAITDNDINLTSVVVSEEGLTDGAPDTTGTSDTTNSKTTSGSLDISHLVLTAGAVFALTAPAETLKVAGEDIVWSGNNTGTLTGSVNGNEVIKITLDNSGDYTVTLSQGIDHDTVNVEDILSFNTGIKITDGDLDIESTLSVTVEDDSPVINNVPVIDLTNAGTAIYSGTLDVNYGGDGLGYISAGLQQNAVIGEESVTFDPVGTTTDGLNIIEVHDLEGNLLFTFYYESSTAADGSTTLTAFQDELKSEEFFELNINADKSYDFTMISNEVLSSTTVSGEDFNAFGPIGQIATLDESLVIYADNADATDTSDAANASQHGVGVDTTTIDLNQTLFLDFANEQKFVSFTLQQFTGGGDSDVVEFTIVTDDSRDTAGINSTSTISVSKPAGDYATVEIVVDDTKVNGSVEIGTDTYTIYVNEEFSNIDIQNTGGKLSANVNNITYDQVTSVESMNLGFDISVTDTDGDTDTGSISVNFENTTANITLSAYDTDENAEYITYTLNVDNAPADGSPLTVQVQVAGESTPREIVITNPDTTATFDVAVRADDYYTQADDTIAATIIGYSGGGYSEVSYDENSVNATVIDDFDVTSVSITGTVTKPAVIDVDNVLIEDHNGISVYALNADGTEGDISINNNPVGFGVDGTTTGSGADSELGNADNSGNSEKIVVEFEKEVISLDVALAWRNPGETAKVSFYNEDEFGNDILIGWATVSGGENIGGDTWATVTYYDENDNFIKEVTTQGGTDVVDDPYTFEPGNGETFTKAVFSAPGYDDDYLIHEITYKEVVDASEITDVLSQDGEVTLQITTSNPPQTPATAIVLVGDTEYSVGIGTNGIGTLNVPMYANEELSATVLRIEGGGFESVDVSVATVDIPESVVDTVIANEAGLSSDGIEASLGGYTGTSIELTDKIGDPLAGETVVAKVTDTNGNVLEVNAKYQGEELEYQELSGVLTAVSKDTGISVFTISENVTDNTYKVTMLQKLDPVTSSVSVAEDQIANISLDTTGGSADGISISLSSNKGNVYESDHKLGVNHSDGSGGEDRYEIEGSEKLIMDFTANSNIVITSVAVSFSNFDESYSSFFGGYHDGDDASVSVYYAGESNPYNYYVDADNANGITISIPEGKTLDYIDFGTVDSNDEYSIADNITVTYDETTSVTLDNPEQTFEFGAQIINGNDQQFVTFDVTVDNDNTLEANIGDVVAGRDSDTIIDTLSIDSDNDTIDFSEIAQNAKNIEAVDFTDGKAQMIENIDLQDVVDMTDDEDDLVIIGENGDEIELKDDLDGDGINDWQTDGQAKELQGYEGTFVEYTNSTVSIFVDTDISVDDTI